MSQCLYVVTNVAKSAVFLWNWATLNIIMILLHRSGNPASLSVNTIKRARVICMCDYEWLCSVVAF